MNNPDAITVLPFNFLSFRLSLTSSYPLIVGVEVTVILDYTQLHTHTLGTIPLNEGSARRRGRYLTTHSSYKRQNSMPPAGFFFCLFGAFPL